MLQLLYFIEFSAHTRDKHQPIKMLKILNWYFVPTIVAHFLWEHVRHLQYRIFDL